MSRFTGNVASNAIVGWLVTIGGLILALYIGKMVAGQNTKFLAMIFGGGIAIAICLSLGRNYWLLIPALSGLTGSIPVLPVPFNYAELGTLAAIGLFIIHIALKKANLGYKTDVLDVLLVVNLAWLAIVYLRNPIGFRFSGGDMVGGRAYINVAIAVGAYLVLCHAKVPPRLARFFPVFITIPALLGAGLMVVTQYYPPLGRVIYPFYTGVSISDFSSLVNTSEEAGRITAFNGVGGPLLLLLCSYYPPISLFFPTHLLRMTLLVASFLAILMSGFRNMVVYAGALIAISTVLRKRWADLFIFFAGGLIGVVVLVAVQSSGTQIPYSAQRALSFIPFVDWDQRARKAAEESVQWRVDMWKDAWASDTAIKNKVLGDGFGFSLVDFNAIMTQTLGQGEGFIGKSGQEAFMVTGAFHSGPLSAIRVVGIIGLMIFTLSMVGTAVMSWKMVNLARNTPFYAWSLFIALPIIYTIFGFFIIFGDFKTVLPMLITTMAYVKLLNQSLANWKKTESGENTQIISVGEPAAL